MRRLLSAAFVLLLLASSIFSAPALAMASPNWTCANIDTKVVGRTVYVNIDIEGTNLELWVSKGSGALYIEATSPSQETVIETNEAPGVFFTRMFNNGGLPWTANLIVGYAQDVFGYKGLDLTFNGERHTCYVFLPYDN